MHHVPVCVCVQQLMSGGNVMLFELRLKCKTKANLWPCLLWHWHSLHQLAALWQFAVCLSVWQRLHLFRLADNLTRLLHLVRQRCICDKRMWQVYLDLWFQHLATRAFFNHRFMPASKCSADLHWLSSCLVSLRRMQQTLEVVSNLMAFGKFTQLAQYFAVCGRQGKWQMEYKHWFKWPPFTHWFMSWR